MARIKWKFTVDEKNLFCTSTLRGDSLEISHRRSLLSAPAFVNVNRDLRLSRCLIVNQQSWFTSNFMNENRFPSALFLMACASPRLEARKLLLTTVEISDSDAYRHSNLCWRLSQEIQFLSPKRMTNRSSPHITVIFNFHSNISTRPRILRWLISFSGLVSSLQAVAASEIDIYGHVRPISRLIAIERD